MNLTRKSRTVLRGQVDEIHESTIETMRIWIERSREQTGSSFPEKVRAMRPEMLAHGQFGRPCKVCGIKIQRIRYAENECNYCPKCQTDGKVLAERSVSRLLKDQWPRTIDELEDH